LIGTMETKCVQARSEAECAQAIEAAVAVLSAGQPVALPTETVYGLAADATNPGAILKVFEAKERPFFDPLIVHLPDREWLDRVAQPPGAIAGRLMEKFWPGPLTIILPKRDLIPGLVTSGLPEVAIRMSAHPVFRGVAAAFGKPLAAPSANRFGRISPTSAAHVRSELDGRIPLIVDAGSSSVGLESTIVAVAGETIRVLRSGPITPADLAEFGNVELAGGGSCAAAPGQLKSHYAPRTPLRFLDDREAMPAGRIGLLAWKDRPAAEFAACEALSARGDLREAATNLFGALRRLDALGLDLILAEPVPETGLGLAIMDRLRKAAHD
jgi:L-threonylcarbamoyladenylate synthase